MRKKLVYISLLLCIFMFHSLINCEILGKSQLPRICDESARINTGLSYYRSLFTNPATSVAEKFRVVSFLGCGQAHPHFYEFVEAISWKIAEEMKAMSEDAMILITNAFFLLILLLSTYGIGAFFHDKKTGLLAALLVSILPLVFGHSRLAMLDYPLTCMITLSFYLMIKTKGFSWLFYSILFGIACGLAQLTKETAILFLFIPLIYYFLRSYSSDKKKTVVFNFIIALLAFFIVSGSVYFQKANFLAFHTYLLKMETHTAYPFYYLKYFRQITGPIVFILGLPLLLNYFVNFRKRENLILIWFLAPIALFSISPNCSMRFLLPITPALALILVREIFASEFSKVVKNTLITCFICLALIQYALYNTGFLNKTTTKDAHTLLEIGILSVKRTPYQNAVSELFEIFKKEAVGINSCKSTMCLLEIREIYYPLNRRLLLAQLPFNLICPTETDETDARSASFGKTPEQILSADYLLVTTQYKHISHGPLVTKIRDVLQEGFDRYKDSYRRIAQVKAQDGSIVYVYKKI